MEDAVIVDAIRTPIGAVGGSLSSVRPDDLAALILKALADRNHLDLTLLDEVILGCVNQGGEANRNVARMALLLAGFPIEIPAITVNRLCSSGLSAIAQAARAIKCGDGDVYIAGGVESQSRAPYSFSRAEKVFQVANLTVWDTTRGWYFPNPKMEEMYGIEPMGITAENIHDLKPEITREKQDAFSYESHLRAINAIDTGKFTDEIIPVPIVKPKGEVTYITTDERPRRDTNMASLAKLKPSFKPDGTVTAGNSSGSNDGASAVLMMSRTKALELGYKPLARIVSCAVAGVLPATMGLGPIPATRKALKKAGLTVDDLGLIELNEAFAVQSLAVMEELGFRHEITNVNGGGVSLGHPIGCSGARIMTTLFHEMKRRAPEQSRPYYGLATLCIGVGQGEAVVIEYVG